MILETNVWSERSELEADIVIVGSGAAGITLAMEFINSPFKVLLLEAGSKNFDAAAQDTYKGEVLSPSHHGSLESYRRKVVGGTTTVWGGRCSPLTEIDFKKRDHIKNSGWPITNKELNPFYKRAHDYCDIGEFDYSVKNSLYKNPKIVPDLESTVLAQDEIWRFSLPTNFGEKYISALASATNLELLIGATCQRIDIDPESRKVDGLTILSAGSKECKVIAKIYILAAGGLETTRLLLASNNILPEGIGNSSGLVGSYYASHITGNYGSVKLTDKKCPVSWNYKKTIDGTYFKQNLRVVDIIQESKKLLNTRVILSHLDFGDPRHGSGILSGAYLVKRFLKGQIPPEYSKDLANQEYKNIGKHIRNILFDSPRTIAFTYSWITKRILRKRKLPSIALRSRKNIYTLHYDSEQTHIKESKITLSDKKDANGLPRLKVDWRYDENDIDKIFKTYKTIITEIEKSNAGVALNTEEEVRTAIRNQIGVGSHHIGSTRMNIDPNKGVVDENCKVHDSPNLYLASPSVFCTGGFANPLLTIVALSIRIADEIKSENAI